MAERAERRRAMRRVTTRLLLVAAVAAGVVFGAMEFNERWYFEGLRPVPRIDRGLDVDGSTLASADRSEPNVSDGAIVDTQQSDTPAVFVSTDSAAAEPVAVDSPVESADSSGTSPAEPAGPAEQPRIVPVIAEGRTELGDSVYAVRDGPTVTVHFDTYLTRTRRRDKFDRIVRETLPQVYGEAADSLLSTVPVGQIAQGGDLLGELPSTGISFELADGSTLALWPRTRPGRDGPLVVAYRATILR